MQDPSESDELRFEQEQRLSLRLIRLTPGMTAHGVLTTGKYRPSFGAPFARLGS
jgi:hypothetical protein